MQAIWLILQLYNFWLLIVYFVGEGKCFSGFGERIYQFITGEFSVTRDAVCFHKFYGISGSMYAQNKRLAVWKM